MTWASLFHPMKKWYQAKKEQRNYPRIRTNNLMKETSSVPVLNKLTCNLIDLSEKGFQFNNPHWVVPQQVMDVMINLPERGHQIEATVKIVWCRVIQREHVYCRVGVSFVAIDDDDLAIIRSFVRRRLGRSENLVNNNAKNELSHVNRIVPNNCNLRFN